MAYENASSPITLDYLTRTAAVGVDITYVLTGERSGAATSASRSPANVQVVDDDDLVEVAEIDLKYGLGATYLDNAFTSEKRRFSREWLRNFTRASPASLFWTIGDGDSMEPTIRSGEVILIDASQKTPRMSEGIWAVALGDFGMVKRIHYAGSERIELLSDNVSLQIPPIPVAEGELHVIGRVVAVVRRL
jgi:phage repressor protein C with HTH and peptisase S24 domain